MSAYEVHEDEEGLLMQVLTSAIVSLIQSMACIERLHFVAS